MNLPRVFAATMWAAAAWGTIEFPVAHCPVAAIAGLLAVVVAWRPMLVFAAAALIVPAMDLTPWSGRLYFNEFDIWMLSALAGALWSTRLAGRQTLSPIDQLLIAGLVVSYAGSIAVAWAGSMGEERGVTAYDSPLNALRSARGVAYAAVLGFLLCRSGTRAEGALGAFAGGTVVGLLGVVATVGMERLRFCGLVDVTSDFRVTGPFADMHTGGAYLDAYLVAALPLLATAWRRWSDPGLRALVLGTGLGGVYAACATLSRAPVVIVALQAVTLSVAAVGWRRGASVGTVAKPLLGGLAVVGFLVAAAQAPSLNKRFVAAATDLSTRWDHWERSLSALDGSWRTRLFGVGCGGFAKALRSEAHAGISGYSFQSDGAQAFLQLAGPPLVYFDQRVLVEPGQQYVVRVRGRRSTEQGGLTVMLVEKSLLYSYESVRSRELLVDVRRDEWCEVETLLRTDLVGRPQDRSPFPSVRRPVSLSLIAAPDSVVDVDSVELLDANGVNLVANPGFDDGHDRWWWTADDHLAWHAKNTAVHLIVEQGWLGLLVFALSVMRGLYLLCGSARGDFDAIAIGCSLGGLLLVGVIDSVIDSPRLVLLLFVLLGIAASLESVSAVNDE